MLPTSISFISPKCFLKKFFLRLSRFMIVWQRVRLVQIHGSADQMWLNGENFHRKHSWESRKCYLQPHLLTLYSIDTHFDASIAFENIVEKEEIARNEQFLLFSKCFLINQIYVPHLSIFFRSYSYLLLNWKSPKLAYEVKG